jgi:hypothetical protein
MDAIIARSLGSLPLAVRPGLLLQRPDARALAPKGLPIARKSRECAAP